MSAILAQCEQRLLSGRQWGVFSSGMRPTADRDVRRTMGTTATTANASTWPFRFEVSIPPFAAALRWPAAPSGLS